MRERAATYCCSRPALIILHVEHDAVRLLSRERPLHEHGFKRLPGFACDISFRAANRAGVFLHLPAPGSEALLFREVGESRKWWRLLTQGRLELIDLKSGGEFDTGDHAD